MAIGIGLELSSAVSGAVRQAANAVVRVDGGRRRASSGTVWDPGGVIVTAAHGLDRGDEVELGLPSGERAPAEVVGRDPSTDLAVLRTRASGLATPAWSDAALEVGQLAAVVTRPGRGPRAAMALVARLGDGWRTAAGGRVDRYVELDAAVQPGFSGGLVVDLGGRGLGLASAGLVRGEPLAIPPATLRRVIEAILAHGSVRRGYLGVASLPVRLPAALAQASGQEGGLLLTAVEDASPAGRAGLVVGDLLLALDGAPLREMADLLPALEEEHIGRAAHVRLARGGAVQELDVVVDLRGDRRAGGDR
jgi:S1-C subfamily serine protease